MCVGMIFSSSSYREYSRERNTTVREQAIHKKSARKYRDIPKFSEKTLKQTHCIKVIIHLDINGVGGKSKSKYFA